MFVDEDGVDADDVDDHDCNDNSDEYNDSDKREAKLWQFHVSQYIHSQAF